MIFFKLISFLDQPLGQNQDVFQGEASYKLVGWRLTLHQFLALIIKRFHHQRRNKKGFLCEVNVFGYLYFDCCLKFFTWFLLKACYIQERSY